MAEKPTYESQFTKENIIKLKNAINNAVNDYAEENTENGRLDIFLILASLGQAAYEVTIRTLPKTDEEAKVHVDKMKVLVDKMVTLMDDNRKDLETKPTAELLASIHLFSVISEFYSRRRDDVLQKIVQEAAEIEEKEE